jgi:hypothetical protein
MIMLLQFVQAHPRDRHGPPALPSRADIHYIWSVQFVARLYEAKPEKFRRNKRKTNQPLPPGLAFGKPSYPAAEPGCNPESRL